MKKTITSLFFFLAFISLKAQSTDHWETAIFADDTWKYFVGTSEPDVNWKTLEFDDTAWKTGQGGFGFGDNDDGSVIPQTPSVYLRTKFTISDLSKISQVVLSMDYDDAFVAYINGKEIARSGIVGNPPSHDFLGVNHEASLYRGEQPENFQLSAHIMETVLQEGLNVLAIQVHNSSSNSSDMSSNAFLSLGITDNSSFYRETPDWFSPPIVFSTNLPLLLIDTSGQEIIDEPKIMADMKIIHHSDSEYNHMNDSANVYDGKIGIEIRGHFSAGFPQKPYGIETRDSSGENRNVSLLGMPKENDWILIPGYGDKTLLKNTLAFETFRKMGHYAPRFQHVEVFLNGNYQGIYLFGEKIKRDKKRVNISKLTKKDTVGDDLTGGYIFKNDYSDGDDVFYSEFSPINKPGRNVYFVFHDPKGRDLLEVQKEYLKNYIYEAESALYSDDFKNPETGYTNYFDVASFIDYMIVGEFSRNVDHYKKSRYFHKTKSSKSKLIYSGPVWDYDWAFKNINENCNHFNQSDGSGWAYLVNECNVSPVPPSWEVRMMEDENFVNELNQRFFSIRKTFLSNEAIYETIDSVANMLEEAQVRHYDKWKILGKNVGAPDLDPQPQTYAGEILKLKHWVETRLKWLDENMPGENTRINETEQRAQLSLYPNVVVDILNIQSKLPIVSVNVKTMTGQLVLNSSDLNKNKIELNVNELPSGIYLIEIIFEDNKSISRKIIKN